MARIRSIKPEFFRHEGLQELENANPGQHCMLVFAGLWTISDLSGRFEWRPRMIKLDVLPFLDFDISRTLSLLDKAGFLVCYEVGGKRYGAIPSWKKHQKTESLKNEKERCPAFEEGSSIDPGQIPDNSHIVTGQILEDFGKEREKEKEKEKEKEPPLPPQRGEAGDSCCEECTEVPSYTPFGGVQTPKKTRGKKQAKTEEQRQSEQRFEAEIEKAFQSVVDAWPEKGWSPSENKAVRRKLNLRPAKNRFRAICLGKAKSFQKCNPEDLCEVALDYIQRKKDENPDGWPVICEIGNFFRYDAKSECYFDREWRLYFSEETSNEVPA